jgi:hypothetical protein
MKESQIQKSIIDYLHLMEWYVWKNNSVGIFNPKTQKYIKAQTRGISDLTAIKDGCVLFIEVKAENGKQSEYQKEFQNQIESKGGKYLLAKSYVDVLNYTNKLEVARLILK